MKSIIYLAHVLAVCPLVCSQSTNNNASTSTIFPENIRNATFVQGFKQPSTCENFTTNKTTHCRDDVRVFLDDNDVNSTIKKICNETGRDNDAECKEGPSTFFSPSIANTVIKYVGYITVPLFLALSLTGNSLTLIIMFSKRFWNSPCSFLLIALTVSDSTYSIVFPFSKLFVRELIGHDPRALTEVGCHVFFIIHKASKMASSWFIVAICIERFIAVWFPLKAKMICTKRNTMFVVFAIMIGMLIFTGLWTFSTKIVNGICVPNYATPETAILARAYLIAGSSVFSVIPATILIILTPAICAKLHQQSKIRQRLCHSNREVSSETRVNAMLVAVSIAYIILVTPTAIAHNVCFTLNINFYESKLLSMAIARTILQVMEQLNFLINFWLYVMYNRSFRRRALEILTCKKSVRRASVSGTSFTRRSVVKTISNSNMGKCAK